MAHANLRSTSPLEVEPGRRYPGGYEDESVEQFAYEDGQAAVQNASIWGENTHPHAIEALSAAHDTDARLIAHWYRGDVQDAAADLTTFVPQTHLAMQRALDKLDVWRVTQIAQLRMRHEIESKGLKVPGVRSLLWLVSSLAVLFFGETPLISTSFQEFGLSDHPWIPHVQASDELHLAAYGSVTALLVLAHIAGHKLRLLAHDIGRRRLATSDETKAQLPPASRFHALIIAISIVGAVPVLGGLSAIRASYLQSKNTDAQMWPFVAIQIGIFSAAVFLSFMHAHPYGRAWADQVREVRKTEKAWGKAEDSFITLVGSVNATIEKLGMLLAQAGHHVGASEADARRQIALYARRVVLSQPEPTIERLLPKKLPEPSTRTGTALVNFLTGVAPLPTFEHLNTEALTQRQEEIRTELRELEATLSTALVTGTDADPLAVELAELSGSDA